MLTQQRLHDLLDYDPQSGMFIWVSEARVKNRGKGKTAGTVNSKGYVQITIDRKIYLAHRLAWFYVFGTWPKSLDHKDRIKTNNGLNNLREASGTENNGNVEDYGNTTGFRGVTQFGKKFYSWLHFEGTRHYLGGHDSPEQAHEAYRRKHLELYGEFSIYAREEVAA